MAFIQIIEFKTSKADDMRQLAEEWEKATEGKRTAGRRVFTRDREDPNKYLNIVFFDSYDSAMKNSELPQTQEFAKRMSSLVDGSPSFHNLDVVEDRP